MDFRPLHDRLVIRRIEEGEQKRGSIIVPDTAKEKPQRGTIISVGAGKLTDAGERIAPDVTAGDLVLFGRYSGQEVKLEGETYLLMKEDDVLAVIEDGRGDI
jgi:chaperonin GroES